MAYLIDTNIVIYHLNGVTAADRLVDQLFEAGVAISVITHIEVIDGLPESADPHRATLRFNALINQIPVIPISRAEAERCARLRQQLRREGRRIRQRALDLLIAATALEHGLSLVTNNPADYSDIPGLSVQDAGIASAS